MDERRVISIIPYGTRLGFHEDEIASTMTNIDYKFPQCVCYEADVCNTQNAMHEHDMHVVCMSERQISMMTTEGVCNSILQSDHKGPQVVCYSIEGHVVDRETAQNGRGWAEGYAHTLNDTDRHAVCYVAEEKKSDNDSVVLAFKERAGRPGGGQRNIDR